MVDASPDHALVEMARPLKAALTNRAAMGIFLLTGNSAIAEMCGLIGFDWAVLDMEASPMTKQDAFHCIQGLTGSTCSPVVRVPYLSRHHIEHALDVGAHAVLVPKVESATDAARAAAACRFPPEGERGINPVRAGGYFGNVTNYLRDANAATLCLVQIESSEAVDSVEQIAAVPGVDGLFIGMGDLSSAYGQPGVMTGPAMDEARAAVLAATRKHDKIPGIFAYSDVLAAQYVQEGFSLIAIGNDLKFLRAAATAALRNVTQIRPS